MLTRAIAPQAPRSDVASLIELARRQNEEAVMSLIERCASRIVAAIETAGVPRYDASFDDAQNQALLEIWKQFPSSKKNESVCYWMYGVARRVTASRIIDPAVRQRRRDERFRNAAGVDALRVAGPADTIASRDMLGRVLQELSVEHREVLVLRFLEGFSEQETASLLGIPVKTVSSRTSRAKRAAIDALAGLEGENK